MRINLLFLFLIFSSFLGIACLWDNDTIEMEKQDFPEVYDLLTGNFIRHSEEYYQWKIKDRTEKLKSDPNNPRLYDDLAVAYSKMHQDKKAIELMMQKEKIAPGEYETYANMGTFYLHDGQLEKGIEYIEKAIAINPDAHFGREVYQKYLAEYLLEKGYVPDFKLPICKSFDRDEPAKDFYAFLKKKQGKELTIEDLKKAIKGITGMMKFGNWDSPILAETLGDLLFYGASEWEKEEAYRNLAILCYHRAKMKVEDPKVQSKYEARIFRVHQILRGEQSAYVKLAKQFEKDMVIADSSFQKIRVNEIKWIQEGLDVDEKFAEVYYGIQPEPKPEKKEVAEEKLTDENIPAKDSKGEIIFNTLIGIIILAFLAVIVFIIRKNMNKG
ncbi:MAG: hypothetical protein R2799_03935 [Crocinitomicaceae bacterium]